MSNALFNIARTAGSFRFGLTAGAYAFPVIGTPLASTFAAGANTSLYTVLPIAYAQYAPSDQFSISAGKLGTLLGQESIFTYQNINIQRGLGWNAEPVISRGVRLAYTPGKLTLDLELNDGYYSGSKRAFEWLAGWAFTPQTNLQLAAILPDANTPGNPTAAIANKSEYDLMITQTAGTVQFTPYVLWISSPASANAGFTNAESGYVAALLARYSPPGPLSLGMRYEHARNNSGALDTSPNADFFGYGAGSTADSLTLTPTYTYKQLSARAEYSLVTATGSFSQARLGAELLLQF